MALASLARSRACAATAAAAAPRTVTRPSRHGVGGVVRVVQVRPFAAKPEKKKGAKAATAEPSGPRKPVDLYAALVGEPPLTPTKPGEVPEWFLSVYRDWRDGTGEVMCLIYVVARVLFVGLLIVLMRGANFANALRFFVCENSLEKSSRWMGRQGGCTSAS